MAYNTALAGRIRQELANTPGITEKAMFGGLSFLLNGNMACGVIGDDLVVRSGLERNEEALQRPHAREFDFSGRAMKGWVFVAPEGCQSDAELAGWIQMGVETASSMPPK